MNKKILFVLVHACLVPLAAASDQQDFLSSVSHLSLPELPQVPTAPAPVKNNAFTLPPRAIEARHSVRVDLPERKPTVKKRTQSVKKTVPLTLSPVTKNEVTGLKADIQRLEAEKKTLAQQLSESTAKQTKKAEFNPKLSAEFIAMVKELASLRAENLKLASNIQRLETSRTALKAQQSDEISKLNAALQQARQKPAPSVTPAAWAAVNSVDKQSWALGLSLSANVRKTLSQLKDLAIPYSEEGLKQGILAGMVSTKPPEKSVQQDLSTLLKRYDAEIDKRTRQSIEVIRGQLGKQKIAKQNFSTFFVNVKKGKAVDVTEKVLFTLKTETFEGRKIDDVKDKALDLSVPMPDVVLDALDEIGQGGSMTLYCLGADLYNDRTLPPGMYPYTPIKITLSTR